MWCGLRAGQSAATPWAADRYGMSGRDRDAGPGDVVGGELVEGVERRDEFGWCVGPVRCHQRAQDVVIGPGVELREQQPVAGEGVAVPPGNPPDQAVAGEPG